MQAGAVLNQTGVKQCQARGEILAFEPNAMLQAFRTPNDPRFPELWGLHNTGQAGGLTDADIDADRAWNGETGSPDILVGVIDSGIDYTHPDLTANIWINPGEIAGNGIDDDQNGVIDDVHGYNAIFNHGNPFDIDGHGTHVAGTIGAVGNNGIGVAGVNWNVKLVPMKFLQRGTGSTMDAIECIHYAIDLKQRGFNLKVLNNSWGGDSYSIALKNAIALAHDAGHCFCRRGRE